jgi:lycopene cyclase domain-containing protein
MSPPLSYAEFLVVFVGVPTLALLLAGTRLAPDRRSTARVGIVIMVTLAMVWTIPWDNYLISVGVWDYAPGSVALRVGYMPIEEYTFIASQSVLTALWLYRLDLPETIEYAGRASRVVGAVVWVALAIAGAALLGGTGFYLGAILVWAAPLLALQWAVGGHYLWAVRRTVLVGVGVPTLYLWVADRVAIGWGLWFFSAERTTGLTPFGLPVEEATFFLVTNLLLVQGLVLFHWLVEEYLDWTNVRTRAPTAIEEWR